MDTLVGKESSDQKESFKYIFAGRVSSVSSPFSKKPKRLPGTDRKSICLKKCILYYLTSYLCKFSRGQITALRVVGLARNPMSSQELLGLIWITVTNCIAL